MNDGRAFSMDDKEVRPSSVRIYTYRQLCTMLKECGFDEINAYDANSGEPFRLGSSRLLLVAEKKAISD